MSGDSPGKFRVGFYNLLVTIRFKRWHMFSRNMNLLHLTSYHPASRVHSFNISIFRIFLTSRRSVTN